MQNLTTLFGPTGATRFLELAASNYRKPVWKLEALNPDGTVRYDLTSVLNSWDLTMTDDSGVSQRATFQLSNPSFMFDSYGSSAVADVLKMNRVLRFQKGLIDPVNGDIYLLPAFWGQIIQAKPNYSSKMATIQVVAVDALKNTLRQEITTYDYQYMQVNLIASDILQRFGYIPLDRINLYDVSYTYADVQFTGQYIADCLKLLYDAIQFWVRADEAGNIVTAPRLGSPLYGDGLKGYPYQLTEPSPDLVAYTFPDMLIENIQEEVQDYDGVINQVKVLGESVVSLLVLGPVQRLFGVDQSSIDSRTTNKQRYPFSQQPTGTSALVASNVVVYFQFSTNHHLPDAPRSVVLSNMPWRGPYSADTNYNESEGVIWVDGYTYTSIVANSSADPHDPTDTNYWRILADDSGTPIIVDPAIGFVTSYGIFNETRQLVGFLNLLSVTASDLVLDIEGREYSSGGAFGVGERHHGGFDYLFDIYGLPQLSNNTAIAVFADYDAQNVTGETLSDPFDDHVTYQGNNIPFAYSVPVEVFLDTGTGPVSQGVIAADASILTGDSKFGVDWERGRIVFKARTFATWTPISSTPGLSETGGTQTVRYEGVVRLKLPNNPAPEEIYRWGLQGDSTFVFSGLTIGQGYTILLQFFDPSSTGSGSRVFSVYCQGTSEPVIQGLDIVGKCGGSPFYAWQETISGITPDIDGKITLHITTHDPVTGQVLSEAKGNAIVSGIEIVPSQEQGAAPYFVYAGSDQYPAVGTPPPVVTANYGFSDIQKEYGIQSLTIDDPLLATREACQDVGEFWVNYSQWKRNRHTIATSSYPFLQPGDLIIYVNPATNIRLWCYVAQITRHADTQGGDSDSYVVYVIYAVPAE